MIPILYDKTGTIKYGELTECIKGIVIEERNGILEAEITYPVFSNLWDKLVRGNIFIADANDYLKNQKFRIYKISKTISGKFTVYAMHISYDANRDVVEGIDITNQSCEYCLNELFRKSQFSKQFRGYSDIVNAEDFKIGTTKLMQAIVGSDESIIETFGTGAELLRDNYNIHVVNKRGHDNGVVIEYGKNLIGIDLNDDDSNMTTRIRAIAKYTNENNEEMTLVEYADSSRVNEYETPFINEMDFSDKFKDDEIPTSEKLIQLAKKYFTDNNCDIPKTNAKLQFIPLSKCVGYEGIQDKLNLCDIVTIKDYRYNYESKAKIIRAEYDFLSEKYNSMEIGTPRSSIDSITGGNEKLQQGPPGLPGKDGEQGIPGKDGVDGAPGSNSYFHIKYSNVPNPINSSQMQETPGDYIGTYVDNIYEDSNDPTKYTWSRFRGQDGNDGENGLPGIDGSDGKTSYLHIKYSSDGKIFTANNGETPGDWIGQYVDFIELDSSDFNRYTWTKIKGETGVQGPQGPAGEAFPNTLPAVPVVTTTVYGFASIELNWRFESKVYYTYELYASKTKDFIPNSFDLICEGQVSSFLFQAKPGETWYFRCCGKNSYGKRTSFSEQISATTTKVDDLSNYVAEMAIGDALVGTLSFDRGWAGTLAANYIDARNLSVTDGDGLRTLDIDNYGNVNLNVASLKIVGRNVATEDSVRSVSDRQDSLEETNNGLTDNIADIRENGVSKVGNSLVTIDDNGIKVGRENSQFENLQSETGNYMYSYGKEIARYDKDGLKTSYAVLERAQVGHLRFENGVNCQQIHYIENLAIGGITTPTTLSRRHIENYEGWEVD